MKTPNFIQTTVKILFHLLQFLRAFQAARDFMPLYFTIGSVCFLKLPKEIYQHLWNPLLIYGCFIKIRLF